jgi:hypothetical protein
MSRNDNRRVNGPLMKKSQQRIAMLAQLDGALDLAEQLGEPKLVYLIERALDEARSKAFNGIATEESPTLHYTMFHMNWASAEFEWSS